MKIQALPRTLIAGFIVWLLAIACMGFSSPLYFVLTGVAISLFLLPVFSRFLMPRAQHGS